ncbi:hypothetical protein FNV43_RR14274 [Rhamnella rubrinervis]|uniref:Uncharacterized protein n=1 Tax=Rhamnella rubrinervis TaxID=2594499 RepID=A0A8K0H2M9_9ROSA|nr:hypothetical protein FNV43_RR14274 [Rhamnella rubrinervis]
MVVKPAIIEDHRRALPECRSEDEKMDIKSRGWRECSEEVKIKEEEAAKEQKILLEELEEPKEEKLKRQKSGQNI